MRKSNIAHISTHPVIVTVFLLLGLYLAFFSKMQWMDSFFEHKIVLKIITYCIYIFYSFIAIIFIANCMISINDMLFNKRLFSRLSFHIAISVLSMLILSLLVLGLSVFFISKSHQEWLLSEGIAKQHLIHSIDTKHNSISLDKHETNQENNQLRRLVNDDNVSSIITRKNVKALFQNHNRNYRPPIWELFLFISVILILLIIGYNVYLHKIENKNAHKNAKTLLDSFMYVVRFIAISSFRMLELIFLGLPFWVVLITFYVKKMLVNNDIFRSLIQYLLIFYAIGFAFIIINYFVIQIIKKTDVRKTLYAMAFPTWLSFASGSSIVSMYASVHHSIRYLKGNPFTTRFIMPFYFFFFRMGNVIYLVFITFVCFQIFSPILFPIDFVLLACFATLFSFIPTVDNGLVFIFLLSFFLPLFGIPLNPALIILLGIDVLLKPMRSALTTNFAITIVSLCESKHEKSNSKN